MLISCRRNADPKFYHVEQLIWAFITSIALNGTGEYFEFRARFFSSLEDVFSKASMTLDPRPLSPSSDCVINIITRYSYALGELAAMPYDARLAIVEDEQWHLKVLERVVGELEEGIACPDSSLGLIAEMAGDEEMEDVDGEDEYTYDWDYDGILERYVHHLGPSSISL